ncbi:MAG: hypothetical protein ABI390_04790 [Daejeonella sp.]
MSNNPQIELIANSLLPGFIPKDPAENSLSFNFTIATGKTYHVNYKRITSNKKSEWEFVDYSEVKIK